MMDPLFHMDSIGLDSLGSGSMHHGVCDPHMNGLSLQEMIDTDIKAEFDDVLLPSEGGAGFSNMDTLDGLLDSADFKLDDVVGSTTVGAGSGVGMHGTGYSSLSYLEDFGPNQGNVLVNPNNVMPCTSVQQQQAQQPSPALSVNTQFTPTGNPASVLSPALSSPAYQQQHIQQLSPIVQQQQTYQQQAVRPQQFIVKPSIVSGTGGGASAKTVKILPPNGSPAMHQQVQGIHAAATVIQSSTAVIATTTGRTKKQQQPKQAEKENGYPKPGYSYSCLIALALKNSHTGHLSVSEIYKFMCEHFPYFKTAPAGWKNSVRHNLSLNKCFEKIEKPSVGGANQRKGCLWAMNPAKINKMDEEVLKWSRKDPMAIKKGMVHPHTLEKLERGEMIKDYNANTTNGGGNGGNDSEDEDDPKSPTSISSQSSSQGYDSAGSDFVDIEGFASIPDSSLPELQLQASGNFGGAGSIFEELGDERLQLLDSPVPQHTTQHQSNVTNGGSVYSTSGHQQIVRLATAAPPAPSQARQGGGGGHTYYPTAIHANYAIAPASAGGSAATATNLKARTQQTLVVTRQEGPQKVFTVGAPALTS